MVVTFVAPLLSAIPVGVKTAQAVNTKIRQEINILDSILSATSGNYATSSEIVTLEPSKYTGATYYFEVVAKADGGAHFNVTLRNATSSEIVSTVDAFAISYRRFRSVAFTAPGDATQYKVTIDNTAGISKYVNAARIIILQDSASITNTQTQIEIGSATTTASNTTTLPLQSPKYWYYDSSKWDPTPTFYAEVSFQNTQTSSSTVYATPGTFSYTVTTPATSYTQVEAWGGGGGGGGAASGGGGGGGGAYARSTTTPGTSTHTLVVGDVTSRETDGNNSTYDTTVVVAEGGRAANNATGGAGGNGTVSVGDVEEPGGAGGNADTGPDTGGGGGGSGGPSGGGSNGQGGQASVGGGGGTANCECTNTYQANGGNGGEGGSGTSAVTGGNGGGGSDTSNATGGSGGSPGGGGGGGDSTSAISVGASGQIKLTETHGGVGIAIEEDDGSFANWTFKAQIVSNGISTTTSSNTRSSSFTPTTGRNYRIVASTTASGATYNIFNAKIVADQSGGDISGASNTHSKSVNAQNLAPTDLFFNPDGTKMFTLDNVNDSVDQYTLSTAYDVSTATYDSKTYSFTVEESDAWGLSFSTDGTSMYTLGQTTKKVHQYTLGTPFDVSTAAYSSKLYDATPDNLFSLRGLHFSSDGTKMYLVSVNTDDVSQYTLGTPFDVSTASSDSKSYTFTEDTNPQGVYFNSDGTKMYMIGSTNDSVYQYSLSVAYDVSTATYDSISKLISGEENDPQGIFFKADDSEFYIIGTTNDTVYQYTIFDGVASLETQYLLANKLFAAGTSLQDFDTLFDPDNEWGSVTNVYIHEANSVSGGTSDVKLQYATALNETPIDITGSTITDVVEREQSSSMTMLSTASTTDVIATSNNSNLYASRILVQVTISVTNDPALSQLHYRWRYDNGSETTAVFRAAEDTALTSGIYLGDRVRLRLMVSNTGGSATDYTYLLEHASSSCSSGWISVPTLKTHNPHWIMDMSGRLEDGASTTDVASGLTNPSGTFVPGYFKSTGNTTGPVTLDQDEFTEHEFSIVSTNLVSTGTTYCFRVTNAGSATGFTYTKTPQISVLPVSSFQGGGGNNESNGSGAIRTGGGPSGGGAGGAGGEQGGSGSQQGGGGAGGGGGGDSGFLFPFKFFSVESKIFTLPDFKLTFLNIFNLK